MADTNAGKVIQLTQGTRYQVSPDGGTTWHEVRNVKGGTLKYRIKGYTPMRHMEYGNHAQLRAGAERPSEVSVVLHHTDPVAASNAGILPHVMGSLSGNKVVNVTSTGDLYTFQMRIWVPTGRGDTTGTLYVFAKCFMPEGVQLEAASGEEFDTLSLECENYEMSPTIQDAQTAPA